MQKKYCVNARDVRGQVTSRLFFQNSTKRNRNNYALMILLATTVVMHSTFNTHTHAEKQGHNQGHTSQINLQKNTATPNK